MSAFIWQVPDYWKTYVHEIDQEREIWLNSFYKSPFRIPMPAELEYWWEKEEPPEFILVNKEPEPDPEDPSKFIYTEDPLILHTPTGRLINYIEDEKYGVRLFWQPPLKEGEDIDSKEIEFLPLGFDEFYGRQPAEEKKTMWQRVVMAIEKVFKPVLDKLENWTEEQKKVSELKMQLYEKELDLIEAELCLEEAIEDLDEDLKKREEEEEKKVDTGLEEEDTSALPSQAEKVIGEDKVEVGEGEDEDEEEEEEEEEDNTPSSFGSVTGDQDSSKNDQDVGKKSGESPFSSLSLSFASRSLVSSTRIEMFYLPDLHIDNGFHLGCNNHSYCGRKADCCQNQPLHASRTTSTNPVPVDTVHFPSVLSHKGSLKAMIQAHQKFQPRNRSNGRSHLRSASVGPKRVVKAARAHTQSWLHAAPDLDVDQILSLHTPIYFSKSYTDTTSIEAHSSL
ncbi:hypothetical protein Patl1_30496 [Pistacia atlantica]|uniref:Uncharacterized protein n=1 Tax=Pistacia atlantica TaxID=434234 RepID=A0ACC1A8L4_9ROSI|nr:hypothetical protein Patl1_30496 [Pistacia atlantica]